jgi:hypothetical protein
LTFLIGFLIGFLIEHQLTDFLIGFLFDFLIGFLIEHQLTDFLIDFLIGFLIWFLTGDWLSKSAPTQHQLSTKSVVLISVLLRCLFGAELVLVWC